MQLSPYNHSLQTEFHVPEISEMNKNNTSLYACCDKLCIQNSCENLRKTRGPVGEYVSLLLPVFPNRRIDGTTGKFITSVFLNGQTDDTTIKVILESL